MFWISHVIFLRRFYFPHPPPPSPLNNPTCVILISDADGGRSPRCRRSESRSARHNEERRKLEDELKLLREQINTLTKEKKALEGQLSEKGKDQSKHAFFSRFSKNLWFLESAVERCVTRSRKWNEKQTSSWFSDSRISKRSEFTLCSLQNQAEQLNNNRFIKTSIWNVFILLNNCTWWTIFSYSNFLICFETYPLKGLLARQ